MYCSSRWSARIGEYRRVTDTPNFCHHVKRHEEINKDGQNVCFSSQRGRSCIAGYLYVLRVVAAEDCQELFVTVADVSINDGLVQLAVER